jgi:hypothetical protein
MLCDCVKVTTPYLTRDSIMRLNITACLLPGYSLAYAPMVARDEVQFLHQVGNAAQTGTGCSLYTGNYIHNVNWTDT